MPRMKVPVLSLKEKTTQPWFYYFQIAHTYYKSFKTDPLNIIFDDFDIWLLGFRIKFSCLYIPQEYYFISTLWLWSTVEYFERKSIFKRNPPCICLSMVNIVFPTSVISTLPQKVPIANKKEKRPILLLRKKKKFYK